MKFELNPNLDIAALSRTYADTGRVSIHDFLAGNAAQQLHDALRARNDWIQILNSKEKVIELSREVRASLSTEQMGALDDAVHADARYGFQYRYESIRIPDGIDDRIRSSDVLAKFARWFSSDTPLALVKAITGEQDILFADAQATAYSPGDFLTGHDDAVPGKGRRAAYVFGLTPVWRTEWGGLLLFHDEGNGMVEGMIPAFNRLNLFAVPQMHSVSPISAAAGYRRYAITGWLRNHIP
ncbi:2OG-Fe(II) oxygenase family protein [Sphingobium sp. CR2-8]|uniref:2OG-Fe(II) oxygenase n=1 Tax=Sphingobium sp. CR2-8 TaxID=1306534 RepID=UPI002DB808FB|nr:2OG-Fe(II) oxygenase family protein [Sphingobium sp. CR2-8]MEC3912753.1 2OG-Fe(II) oxygenase family protein [Sphingobium sp. CR2-8]